MGVIDTEGKLYLSRNDIFADAFNFLLHDGKPVIKPEELKELDTTEIAIPYGNGARIPVQKQRDLLRLWSAMMDDNAIYLMLGAELQGKVHYAVPVKNGLYDMIGYASQVEQARRSYKKKKDTDERNIFADGNVLKIKLTSEEFLSGFRKEDKLIPIITATVYLSDEEWDGPLNLHDMVDVKDKSLLKFIPNYPINLIAPANIRDDEFGKFSTELGFAMKVLKHQRAKEVSDIILATGHRKVDRGTAVFLNRVANLGLVFEEEEGDVDMCAGMEKKSQEDKVTGAIQILRATGSNENDIIEKIIENFGVTKEYVLALLAPKTA